MTQRSNPEAEIAEKPGIDVAREIANADDLVALIMGYRQDESDCLDNAENRGFNGLYDPAGLMDSNQELQDK